MYAAGRLTVASLVLLSSLACESVSLDRKLGVGNYERNSKRHRVWYALFYVSLRLVSSGLMSGIVANGQKMV